MSDVEEEVVNNEAPVASEAAEEVEAPAAASEEALAPVEEETESESVAPVEEDPAEEAEGPVEEAEEAPVESEAVEEPVEEAPSPEPEEEAPVASEAVEHVDPVPVEQVASDIREILAPVSVENAVSSDVSETDNICSLKTLINVLGKWSGGEIRKRQVEDLLKEGSEVDDNLDDLEKVVEVLQLWFKKGSEFKKNNHFLRLDEYTLVEESRNLDSEKKNKLLGKLIKFLIDCSLGKYNNEKITEFFNNFY